MELIQIIGYTGTILVMLSYLSDGIKLRVFSMIACILFIIYGVGIDDGPLILTNVLILSVNIFKVIQSWFVGHFFSKFRVKCEIFKRTDHNGESTDASIFEYRAQYKPNVFGKWLDLYDDLNEITASTFTSTTFTYKNDAHDIIERFKTQERCKLRLHKIKYYTDK